jgi:hypothetical protein
MKSPVRLAVAALAVAAMTLGVAAPAAAQETLGFEIDPTEGFPGDVVNGQVNVDDVAAHCVTDVEEFMARFGDLFFDPDLFAGNWLSAGGELWDRFFPTGDDFETHEQLAFALTGLVVLGLMGIIGPEPAEEALPQTFVMTFADIATQDPVGEMGNFDPDTGEGSVVVPDVAPGLWAVAAACVGPSFDIDVLEAGIRSNGPFLEELGAPVDVNSPEFIEFAEDFTGEQGEAAVFAFVAEIGATLLAPIMVPDALGFELFDVLSDEEPPVEEPPVDEAAAAKAVAKAVAKVTIDITITGVDPDAVSVMADALGVDVDVATAAAPAAQAVTAAPTFTG